MEEGKRNSAHGVFAHLERLEAEAREIAVKEEKMKQEEEKQARLKARVRELSLQRDMLLAKVRLQKKRLREKRAMSDPAKSSARAVLEWKIKNIKGMLQISYLTGISGKQTKQGVCFCISTAYESTYLDSYYVHLLVKPEVQIYQHSVPTFIPLEEIAKKYLQTDIGRFLSVLSDHLNAYAGRKYQADQLQEHFSDQIEGTVQRNSLCNLLVFNYKVSSKSKTFPFNVRLLYGDLCCSLPTEVNVSCTPDAPASLAEMAAAHSDLFRRVALHKAFRSFSSAEESVDGAP
ncbi:centromere protein O isoform X1 [Aquila chrysaetos chrysaetos]|uniref:Centromere protein O n=1 Tax=Aquila chrysaetos chrysaetos TaxID=223781 RepID=A0A663EC74_AQUCH|nr:centromere protein O isoform X1 [Aquila chrysaetos chrysaetos]XP_029893957.1 centromere protein O isoform X1 [Aquila chrysaetos chrysaetos]